MIPRLRYGAAGTLGILSYLTIVPDPTSPVVQAAAVTASGPATQTLQPAGTPLGAGPVRQWRGMLIQSLDEAPGRPAEIPTPQALLDSPLAPPPAGGPPSRQLEAEPRFDRPYAQGLALSNERTFTMWAHATECARIYTSPFAPERRVARLHLYTEEGFPEIYLLLRLHRDSAGREWVQVRLPKRPNGEVGWVRREALGAFHATRDLLVLDRRRQRLRFCTGGLVRWSAAVSISDRETPTPPGRFWIRQRFKIFDHSSGYWPYAFGTADYAALSDGPAGSGGAVVIHGSQLDAETLPARPANGCIGVRVPDDAWLGLHLGLGTPLRVL
jgi:hypothetical protein